jgi:hypothetical protein
MGEDWNIGKGSEASFVLSVTRWVSLLLKEVKQW